MAISGVLRPGFVQLRVLDLKAALKHYVDHIGLNKVMTGPDGRVYLKAPDEFDHHSLVLREAAEAGIDVTAFKVAKDADLDHFAARIEAWGLAVGTVPAGEQPGLGRRIGVTLPTGHRIELYAHADLADDHPEISNPEIWKAEPRGMRAQRMDHILLYGPGIGKAQRFFEECLDFALTEKVETPDGLLAIWLSCSNKAHDVAFVEHATPNKLHHVAFQLEDWNDIGNAADLIGRYDIALDIGPTRHGITRGQTIYFFDPSGNRNEVFSGGYTYYPDNPTRGWDADHIGKAIFYYERALNERFLGVVT